MPPVGASAGPTDWYRNDGSGQFSFGGAITLDQVAQLLTADVDGDGASDLVILSRPSGGDSRGRVQVWLRRTGADRWAPLPAVATGQRPYRLAADDLNAVVRRSRAPIDLDIADGVQQLDVAVGAAE